jgi:prepilin-type N-terminal cleavage/methylation domain-containing protein/prepilin-type processing-associated H-X9-DG protein
MRRRGRRGGNTVRVRSIARSSTIHSRGFTLIELLVVVGLIALLLAILLPSLQLARSHAQAVVCLSHLKQWGTTFALYTQENEGRLPPTTPEALWLMRGVLPTQEDANEPRVGRSIRTQRIACCPRATTLDPSAMPGAASLIANSLTTIRVTSGGALNAWEIMEPGPPFRGSYGLNMGLFMSPPSGYQSRVRLGFLGVDTLATKRASRIPLLLDSPDPTGYPSWVATPTPDGLRPKSALPFCMKRHGTYVNGLFLDWSARRIDLKELWVLPWYPSFDTAGRWTKAGGVQPEDWPKWLRGCKDY